jgi:hypothetical protein
LFAKDRSSIRDARLSACQAGSSVPVSAATHLVDGVKKYQSIIADCPTGIAKKIKSF